MFTRRTALGALAALMLMGAGARAVDEMPGQWGEVGKDYIMGKGHRLRFRLVSMEYRVDPVCIGKQAFAPKADEKLLVVHYVLQNAETTNYTVSWNSVNLSAVDATEATCKGLPAMGNEIDKQALNIELKPAQKVEVYRVIRVAAAGPAKKLIVLRDEPPVLRFDLLEKCKPARLAKELADPADGTGTTPAQPLSAKLGQKMPLGGFELSVDSFATGVATCDGKAPKAGAQWVLVTATVRNLVPTEERFSHTSIKPTLVSGETAIKGKYLLLQTGVDAVLASSVLAPGATRSFRWAFEAPTELTTPKLHLEWQATDRKAVLDLVAP